MSKTQTASGAAPWPKVRLGDVCEINYGTRVRRKDSSGGEFPVYGGGGETFRWPTYNRENQCIVSRFAMSEECVRFVKGKFFLNDSGLSVSTKEESLSQEFLDWCLYGRQPMIYALGRGSAQRNLEIDKFEDIQLPLPPLAEQKKIVEKVEKALKRVDALKAQFERMEKSAADYFKAALAETFAAVKGEKVKLGDVCKTGAGGTPLKQNRAYYDGGTIPWLRSGEVCRKDITGTEMFITRLGMDCSSAKLFPVGSVLVAMYGATAGQVGILRISATTNQAVCAILPTDKVIPEFLYYQLLGLRAEMVSQAQGGAQPNISQEKVRGLLIFVPQMGVQQQVVGALDAAKAKSERMVAAARRGIEICGKMRKAILAEAFQ